MEKSEKVDKNNHKKKSTWAIVASKPTDPNVSKLKGKEENPLTKQEAKIRLSQIKVIGHLHKWVNVVRGWKRRYFSLCNGVFKYSQRKKEIDEKAFIINLTNAVFLKQGRRQNGRFVIDTGTLIFNLRAKTYDQREEWVAALVETQDLLKRIEDFHSPPQTPSQSIGPSPRHSLQSIRTSVDTIKGSTDKDFLSELRISPRSKIQESIKKIEKTKQDLKTFDKSDFAIHATSSDKSPRRKKDRSSTSKRRRNNKDKKIQEELQKMRDELLECSNALISHSSEILQEVELVKIQNKQLTEKLENINRNSLLTSEDKKKNNMIRSQTAKATKTTSEEETSSEEYFDVEDGWEGDTYGSDDSSDTDDKEFFSDLSVAQGSPVKSTNEGGGQLQPSNSVKDKHSTGSNYSRKNIMQNFKSFSVTPEKASVSLEDALNCIPAEYKPRTQLPHFRNDDIKLNIGKFLKDAIGKDLTRITMPVVFSEPLSLLQRLGEEYGAYTEMFFNALKCDDSQLRLAYIAGFAVSSYASTPDRLYKPFNPILGETYELVNAQKRYRLISEQVSHHPPISACIVEGEGWTMWGHAEVKTKFWGKSLQIDPVGKQFVSFEKTKDLFMWNKVTTIINNIVLGNKWVDHYGEMILVNGTNGDKCKLNFEKTSSWFGSSSSAKVTGDVYDKNNTPAYRLEGTWTEYLDAIPYTKMGDLNEEGKIRIWNCAPWPNKLKEQFNYTSFAIAENELPNFLKPYLPITDCRFRPDQRAFENGDYDFSQEEKSRLENLQREHRKIREIHNIEYKPRWFKLDESRGTWVYKGGYWESRMAQKWEGLTNIFGIKLENGRTDVPGIIQNF